METKKQMKPAMKHHQLELKLSVAWEIFSGEKFLEGNKKAETSQETTERF